MQTAVLESRSTVTKPAAKKCTTPLSPQVADRLLELLSSDDEFRKMFKEDPTIAVSTLGHALPVDLSNYCLPVSELAPKEHFRAARQAIKSQITQMGLFTNPHCYEAGDAPNQVHRKLQVS